jgi:hypothetical protein
MENEVFSPKSQFYIRNLLSKINFFIKITVEVLYEDKWWPARIVFKHRGDAGYAIHYHDEDGCEEQNVEENRIRPIQE